MLMCNLKRWWWRMIIGASHKKYLYTFTDIRLMMMEIFKRNEKYEKDTARVEEQIGTKWIHIDITSCERGDDTCNSLFILCHDSSFIAAISAVLCLTSSLYVAFLYSSRWKLDFYFLIFCSFLWFIFSHFIIFRETKRRQNFIFMIFYFTTHTQFFFENVIKLLLLFFVSKHTLY